MMFIEYDPTINSYVIRFGTILASIGKEKKWNTLSDADVALRKRKMMVGRQTNNRTWQIERVSNG